MPQTAYRPLLCLLGLALGALGPGAASANTTATTNQAIRIGHSLGSTLYDMAGTAGTTCIDAVTFATLSAGGWSYVTTGTVHADPMMPRYEPTPSDHLVVVLPNDAGDMHFAIDTLQGDLQQASQSFFDANHQLRFRYWDATGHDATLASTRWGREAGVQIAGTVMIDGLPLSVALEAADEGFSDIDSTGGENRSVETLTGVVEGPNFRIQVAQEHRFTMVYSSGPGGAMISNTIQHLGHTLEMEGHTYVWSDVTLRKAFRDGRPSEIEDYWLAQGLILRDGVPYGQYRLDMNPIVPNHAGTIDFKLDIEGETLEVESWPIYAS